MINNGTPLSSSLVKIKEDQSYKINPNKELEGGEAVVKSLIKSTHTRQ